MISNALILLRYQSHIISGAVKRHLMVAIVVTLIWLAFAAVTSLVGFGVGTLAANHLAERASTVLGITGLLSGFTVVMSITFALSSLYFAGDLEWLAALPLNSRSLFLSRVAAQSLLGLSLGAVLAGPALGGFLLAQNALLATPIVLLAFASLAVWGVSIGTAITVLAVRLVPARYVRDASAVVATLAVFLVAASNLALRGPDAFTSLGPGDLHLSAIGTQVGGQLWFWGSWTGNAINAAASQDWLGSTWWCGLLLVSGAALLLLLPVVLERPYVAGVQASRNASGGTRAQVRWRGSGYPSGLALMVKDLRMLKRDGAELAQLLLPMSLFALYLGSPAGSTALLNSVLPPWYAIALKAAFASIFVASGLGLRAISFENRAIWLLKGSAMDSRRIVMNKFLLVFTISCGFAFLLLWIGEFRAGLSLWDSVLPSTLLVAALAFGMVSFAIALGSLRPRFGWSDPRRSLSMLVVAGFMLGSLVLLTTFFVLLGLGYVLGPGLIGRAVALCLSIGSITGGLVLLELSARRFAQIEV
jgi:hypothetical protein